MNGGRQCITCRFSEMKIGADDEPRIDCRRYPPLVVPGADGEMVVVFPQVQEDDWCGEHEMLTRA